MSKQTSSSDENLARVGADSTGPSEESPPSPRKRARKKAEKTAEKKWSSSAQEQLVQFKGVPVVGGLPFRLQYLIAAAVLGLSVLVLIGMGASKGSGPSPAFPAVREAAQNVVVQAGRSSTGQAINAKTLQAALDVGTKASAALGEQASWKPVGDDAQALLQRATQLGPVFAAANAASSGIEQALIKNPALWTQINQEGSSGTVEATALAQVWGSYRSLHAQLQSISLGGPVSERLSEDVQTITAGFSLFRSSPMMGQDTYLTRAWREFASSWGAISPELDKVLAAQTAINQRSVGVASVAEHALALEKTLTAKERATGVSQSGSGLLWLPAFLALGSLGLLIWVAWKQQRWQVLSSQAIHEQSDEALVQLIEDLHAIGGGDLTARVRVSALPIGTAADTFNQVIDELRRSVQGVKKTVDETKSIIWEASESSGVLVTNQRQRSNSLEASSQKILQLIELVGVVAQAARNARSLAEQASNSAMLGRGSVSYSSERMNSIRERVEEATSRTQRLVKSSTEIASIAESMNNLSEQLAILGVQASLKAAKAGDAGSGFRIIAQEIQKLAEATGERARHVTNLVETELSDLEALSSSMNNANDGVDEGVRFTESAHDAWRNVSSQLDTLAEQLSALRENTKTQEDVAGELDTDTRAELNGLNRAMQEAQRAAETNHRLVSSVQAVDTAISKIKA